MPLARKQADIGDDEGRQVVQRDLRSEAHVEVATQEFIAMVERGQPRAYHQRNQGSAAQVHRHQGNGNQLTHARLFHGAAA